MPNPNLVPPIEPRRSPVRSSARYNAAKHGILSVSPVIPWLESEDDWYDFRDGLFDALNPSDQLQAALADRAAGLFWRLMGVQRFEREVVTDNLRGIPQDMLLAAGLTGDDIPEPGTPEHKRYADTMAMARLIPDDQTLNTLNRYEGRLHRHLNQTLRQIALLKKWTDVFNSSTAPDELPHPPKSPSPRPTTYDLN
jgi:hypothetical protein